MSDLTSILRHPSYRCICGVAGLCIVVAVAAAQEGSVDVEVIAIDEDPPRTLDENDQKLYAFCQGAILQSRGVENTILVGNSDDWIMRYLIHEKRFQKACGITEEQVAAASQLTGLPKGETPNRDSLEYQQYSWSSKQVRSLLSNEQLCHIYLHLEGLMALCRPELRDNLDIDDRTRDGIMRLARSALDDKAFPIHSFLFSMPSSTSSDLDVVPYILKLRREAAKLDWEIVETLTAAERARLRALVEKASPWRNVVHGCGAI